MDKNSFDFLLEFLNSDKQENQKFEDVDIEEDDDDSDE